MTNPIFAAALTSDVPKRSLSLTTNPSSPILRFLSIFIALFNGFSFRRRIKNSIKGMCCCFFLFSLYAHEHRGSFKYLILHLFCAQSDISKALSTSSSSTGSTVVYNILSAFGTRISFIRVFETTSWLRILFSALVLLYLVQSLTVPISPTNQGALFA